MKKLSLILYFSLLAACATTSDHQKGVALAEKGLYEQAIPLLENSARQRRYYASMVKLYVLYSEGPSELRNEQKAIEWLREAAKLGDAGTQHLLAVIMSTAAYSLEKAEKPVPDYMSLDEAMAWALIAEDNGERGEIYATQERISRWISQNPDPKRAIKTRKIIQKMMSRYGNS